MQKLTRAGRLVFAASMIGFGILMVIRGSSGVSDALAGPWAFVGLRDGWLVAAALLILGVGITLDRYVKPAALLLAALFVLLASVHYLPGVIMTPRRGANWTRGFEALAMGGAALVLGLTSGTKSRLIGAGLLFGRWLFAVSLVVFGAQHFIYNELTRGLIPTWLPWASLWVYLPALGFLATALAIMVRRVDRLAAQILALQFLAFVLLLHLPDAIRSPDNLRHWTNVFIALSMSGAALIVSFASVTAPLSVDVSETGQAPTL